MKKLLLLACSLFPALVFAQQAQTGPNGFSFIAPLEISGTSDHNFLVDRTDPNERLLVLSLPPSLQSAAPDIKPKRLDDNVLTLTLPKIGFQNDSKRHELFATWLPQFEIFQHNSDQNGMSQQATAVFTYFLTRNMEFSVGDNYRSSHDPAILLSNVSLLLPRSPYSENDIRGNFEFQPNPLTSLGVRYDNTRANFGQTDPFQSRILDSASTGYSFSVTRMLTRTQRLKGTYSIFKIHPINPHAKFEDQVDAQYAFEKPMHSGNLEYRIGLNPTTVVTLAGGVIGLDTGLNYTFHINADKRLGTYFWAGAGYSRSLAIQAGSTTSFAQGLGSNGFYDVVSVHFQGQPTRRTAILLDTTMSRDASGRFVDSNKALMGRVRFDYRLTDREVMFSSFETFQQPLNPYVNAPLARDRFTVGIQISLSSETDRRLNHSNQDAQYVALTDHQRRRTTPQ
jgi:hypothetical protein